MSDFNRSCLNEPNVFETNLHTVNVFDSCLYDTRAQDFAYGILETVGNYYRPNGLDVYYRFDGESFYLRPAIYNPSPSGMGGPSYDTDAAAYFSAVETAGGSFDLTGINATYTESYVKTAHSDFYAGLKTDGLWDKLTEFYLLVGKTFDGLTVKGKGTGTLTNNNFVSGDLLAAGTGAGLSDASSKYLNTGLNMASLFNITDGASFGLYLQTNNSTTNGRLMGRYIGPSNEARLLVNTGETIVAYPGGSSSGIGFFVHRFKDNAQELFKNGTSAATTTLTSLTMPSGNMYLMGINGLSGDTTNTQSFAFISEYLTDTDAANLSLRVNKLMYDLGCETYIDQGILDAMTLDADAQTYAEAVLSAGGNFEAI